MKLLVLYRANSEHGRVTEEFIRDFRSRHQDERVEVLDVDSREGSAIASIYDVMEYPALMVLQHDGQLQKSWFGSSLPLVDEVAAYTRA